jgi:hypothetical protein
MAEGTYIAPMPARHVIGDLVLKTFVVSGASGSTITTNMTGILFAANQPFCKAGTASLVNGLSVSAAGVITLTASGPMVNEIVTVIAKTG